jgi:hypothetical protein
MNYLRSVHRRSDCNLLGYAAVTLQLLGRVGMLSSLESGLYKILQLYFGHLSVPEYLLSFSFSFIPTESKQTLG